MWAPLAAELARDHTVIAPDLRGMGLTSRPVGGYDKETQDHDIAGMLDALQIRLQVELICNLSLPPELVAIHAPWDLVTARMPRVQRSRSGLEFLN
jgi:hypothetical protein